MNAKKGGRSRKDSANLCVVCCEEYEFYAIGSCDHVVCYRCCVRMRVLGQETYCPVCRAELEKVFLTTSWHSFAEVSSRVVPPDLCDKRYGIVYEIQKIKNKVKELLQHKCSLCQDVPSAFRTFGHLRDHMRKSHQLYYCDLCVDHLRKFSHERKAYTRPDLARHRRVGDADDTSHKGHPHCQFCDIRFLDNDELHRHLRKEHYYCHICEKVGSQEYYENYDVLADHFRAKHFLCEDGECSAEKFVVFSTKIDMQAHIALKHRQKLSKAQARQARQVEVDIQFAPRPRPQRRTVTGRDYNEVQSAEQSHRYSRNRNREQDLALDGGVMEDYQQAVVNSLTDSSNITQARSPKSKQKNAKKSKPDKPEQNLDIHQNTVVENQHKDAITPPPSHRQTVEEPREIRNGTGANEFPTLQSMAHTGTQQPCNKPKETKVVNKQKNEISGSSYSNPRQYGLDEDFPSLNIKGSDPVPTSKPSSFPPGLPSKISRPPGFTQETNEGKALLDLGHQPSLGKVPPGLGKALDIKENVTPIPAKTKQQPQTKQVEPGHSTASVQERNQNLVETIQRLLGYNKEKFAEFKTLSGSFRKGLCSADEYYAKCCHLFESNMAGVFRELVDLLPDREKQKELLRAREDAKIKAKQEGKVPSKQQRGVTSVWRAGAQPPAAEELLLPQASLVPQAAVAMPSHEFPSLPTASKKRVAHRIYKPNKPSAPLKSAWVRGK